MKFGVAQGVPVVGHNFHNRRVQGKKTEQHPFSAFRIPTSKFRFPPFTLCSNCSELVENPELVEVVERMRFALSAFSEKPVRIPLFIRL